MSDPIDRLRMPQSAVVDLVKAVPDQLVKEIVANHHFRDAPTPTHPKSVTDALVEKFGKAD